MLMAMFHSLTNLDTNLAAVYISEWCCVLLDVSRHMTKRNNDQNLVRSEGTCSIM